MSENQKVRATRSPAEIYDDFFVPALFHQWGNLVANAAGVAGIRVLDGAPQHRVRAT